MSQQPFAFHHIDGRRGTGENAHDAIVWVIGNEAMKDVDVQAIFDDFREFEDAEVRTKAGRELGTVYDLREQMD